MYLQSNKSIIYSIILLSIYAIYTSYSNVASSLFFTGDLPFIEMDSFWFLNQAKSILFNSFSYNYNPIYTYDLYGYILALISYVTGFNLEYISFYSPIIFTILTVIVILLLFKEDNLLLGILFSFILLSSSYYRFRTSIGFSDTDSGIIFFIFLFIYFLKFRKEYLFIVAILFHWWYLNASIILFPILILYFFTKIKEEETIDKTYYIVIALLPFSFIVKMILLLSYALKVFCAKRYLFIFKYISLAVSIILLTSDIIIKVIGKLSYYVYPNLQQVSINIPKLVEDSTKVGETKIISFIDMLNSVLISNIHFSLLAFIGFFLGLYFYRKTFIYFLPIFLLGIVGLISGIRFFLYLDIALALGLSYAAIKAYNYNKYIGFTLISCIVVLSLRNTSLDSDFGVSKINDNHAYIKETSKLINKDSNVILLEWQLGHIFSYYTESLVSRNGAHHTALMNYFSLDNFINKNEKDFILNFHNYFNEYRTILLNNESVFNIDNFIKTNKSYVTNINKDMYIIIPMDISNHLFQDLGVNEKEKVLKIDFKISEDRGSFVYMDKDLPVNILTNKNDLYSFTKNGDSKIVNPNGYLNIFFNDKFIVTYDKSLEDSFLIKLLTNRSDSFNLVNVNKGFCLFKEVN